MSNSVKHSYCLDSLRGFLSLIVVVQHAASTFIYSLTGLGGINIYVGLAAHYSVLFFFALSGYVIAISISENINRNGEFKVVEYVLARFARIVPPLLGALALSLLLMFVLRTLDGAEIVGDFKYYIRKVYSPDIYEQLKSVFSLTMAGNLLAGSDNVNGALWSLSYEIRLYVFSGLVTVIFVSRKVFVKFFCVALFFVYVYFLEVKPLFNIQIVSFVCFFAGAMAYRYGAFVSRLWFVPLVLLALLVFGAGAFTGWQDVFIKLRHGIGKSGFWMWYQAFAGVFFAVVLVYMERIGKWISVFNEFSSFSYSLYITHVPILVFFWFLIAKFFPWLLEWKYVLTAFFVVFCVVFSKLFSVLFERSKQYREVIAKYIGT